MKTVWRIILDMKEGCFYRAFFSVLPSGGMRVNFIYHSRFCTVQHSGCFCCGHTFYGVCGYAEGCICKLYLPICGPTFSAFRQRFWGNYFTLMCSLHNFLRQISTPALFAQFLIYSRNWHVDLSILSLFLLYLFIFVNLRLSLRIGGINAAAPS